MNDRDKLILKLAMAKLLNTRLIPDDPKITKFMQFHGNEENEYVSLSKEAKRVLLFINTRDTKNNTLQEHFKYSNHHYHIEYIKDVLHNNVKIT